MVRGDHPTEKNRVVEADNEVCPAHKDMLKRSEAFTLLSILITVLVILGGIFFTKAASGESVTMLQDRVVRAEQTAKESKNELQQQIREFRQELRDEFKQLRNDLRKTAP